MSLALTTASTTASTTISVAGESITRVELTERATAIAGRLVGGGVVAVNATPTLETVIAVMAGLAAGVPVVPVPPDAGPIERNHILRDSGAVAVLGAADWADVVLTRIALDATSGGVAAEPPDSATALIMYTSGTTGPPKGVVLSRRALNASIDGLAEAWNWSADDVLVHGLPLFHVHGLVLGVLGALRVGCTLIHTGRPTPEAYAAAHGSLYFGVPTVWSRVCAEPTAARELASARLLVSGSAPLPVSVFDSLRSLTGHAPVERYGMTETLITLSTRADGERRPGWVGTPINGVTSRLVDESGEEMPHDGETMGELCISGSTMFDGYLNLPDATSRSFDSEWFRTGDTAVIDDAGFHRIVGRSSIDIIKTGGYKVGAGEVESALLDHPAVSEVAVVGVSDDDLGQRVVAFVVPSGAVDESVLISHVAESLSVHKRPREIHFVEALPRNAMGKVQKSLLGD